jgi:hypothetical protein
VNIRFRPLAGFAVLATCLAAVPVLAHHSVPGTFKVAETVAVTGTITKVDWINPHIYVYVDVKGKDGSVTNWKVETLPTNHMRRAGVSRADIWDGSPNQQVTAWGNPAINGKPLLFLLRLTYPDGHYIHLYGDPKAIPATN